MCEIAELQWTEGSNSLPGDKRTAEQRVSKEDYFLPVLAGGAAKPAVD